MSKSFYRLRPEDPKAFYLDEGFGAFGDGIHDDTPAFRRAIRHIYDSEGIGTLFIPEGDYLVSDTILIPKGVRLIGFGEHRPRIRLMDNAPGYQQPWPEDKGGSKYVLWFTANLPETEGGDFGDANAGTFYCSLENIDLYAGQGNSNAVLVRSHYAQHSFMAHCDFHIESGRAGIFDVGNQSEDLHFFGGQWGIISTQCSPGWQFILLDSTFDGHSQGAITCSHVGFMLIRSRISNTPTALRVMDNDIEKYLLEDCLLENISDCALSADCELNPNNQQNALRIACRNVPVFYRSRRTGEAICVEADNYMVDEFHYGFVVSQLGEKARLDMLFNISPLAADYELPASNLRTLPDMSEWVSIRRFGARGDGRTDDTAAFRLAVEKARVIYLPEGVYILSDTITLKKDTILVGLHCYTTQLKLKDHTPAFSGFGAPVPMLEIPQGGDCVVNGLGIDAGGCNPRACACLWQGSERSMLRDVKFIGGHGTIRLSGDARAVIDEPLYTPAGNYDPYPLRDWDRMYPSLWVRGGGGVFVDVWSASTYAGMGLYVENTDVPTSVYCMSLEHHVRHEGCFHNVSNWSIYAMQTEEECSEGPHCISLDFEFCRNLRLFNTFIYRVSRLRDPHPFALRTNGCENLEFYGLHSFSQSRYVFDTLLEDVTSGKRERSWELTRLSISTSEPAATPLCADPQCIASGFQFADGVAADSKGNLYFTDTEARRVYRVDGKTLALSVVHEALARPVSLICDTQDNLIVVAEFMPSRTEENPRPVRQTVVYAVRSDSEIIPLPLCACAPENACLVYCTTHRHIQNDFVQNAMNLPEEGYLAPDDITFIPDHPDLRRARSLTSAKAGDVVYGVDEFLCRTFRFTVDATGALTNPTLLAERGESCACIGIGKVYLSDGDVLVYSPEGDELASITLPERVNSVCLGGEDGKLLFITTRSSVFACRA